MPLRIIHTNKTDSATLSVSPSENASFPVANLTTAMRGDVLRTTGVSAQQIRAVWGSAQSVSAAALCQHNLTAAATWRVRLYSDNAFTTSVYDSGTVTAYDSAGIGTLDAITDPSFIGYKNSVLWFSAVNAQSMTIDLTDAANPAGYLSAARMIVGGYTELAYNFDWGHPLNAIDPTTQSTTLGGSLLSQDNGPIKRELQLDFARLAATDRNFMFDLIRTKGKGKDVYVSAWPGATGKKERDYQFAAKLTAWQGVAQPMLNYYGTSATFGEY